MDHCLHKSNCEPAHIEYQNNHNSGWLHSASPEQMVHKQQVYLLKYNHKNHLKHPNAIFPQKHKLYSYNTNMKIEDIHNK